MREEPVRDQLSQNLEQALSPAILLEVLGHVVVLILIDDLLYLFLLLGDFEGSNALALLFTLGNCLKPLGLLFLLKFLEPFSSLRSLVPRSDLLAHAISQHGSNLLCILLPQLQDIKAHLKVVCLPLRTPKHLFWLLSNRREVIV